MKETTKTEKIITMVETVINGEVTMIEMEVEVPVDRKTDDVAPLVKTSY